MRRSLRQVRRLAAVRRSTATLASVLFLAGCVGTNTLADHAAFYARLIASTQGFTVQSVSCSPRGEVAWTCTGRLQSGREFTCSVGAVGRVSPNGTCTAQAGRP
jgi:hypothetical protein